MTDAPAGAGREDRPMASGHVAMVTGASRGLGRHTALELARRGASLVICARDVADLERTAVELRAAGAATLAVSADLRSARDIQRLAALAFDRFGRVDSLFNNASELGPTPLPYLADYSPAAFEDVLQVDLVAPFRLAQTVIGDMLRRGSGVILNVSSDVAVTGSSGWGAYAVSKAGLDALTRTWAAELEGTGVRMWSIDPGDMDTAMHHAALPDDDPAGLLDPRTIAPVMADLLTGALTLPSGARVRAPELLAARSNARPGEIAR
jgi:NAD(P)-dependent dehydrogenase (short-subunit alcohol dehydrogenase family)